MAQAHRKAIRRRLDRVEVVLLQELQRLLLLILLLLADQGGHAESALRPKAVTGVLQVAILECVLTCLTELGLRKGRVLCLLSVRSAIEYTRITLIHLRQLRHA